MHAFRKIAALAVIFAIAFASASVAGAQRPGTIELGAFGHFTKLDDGVKLGSNSMGLGGRIGFFPIRYLALEGEYSFGTIKSNVRDVSMWLPFRGLVVGNITVAPRVKLLLGAGYKYDTWKGDTTKNEFEDGFALLGGLRICLKNNWSVRPEVMFDQNPSPNNQSPVTSTSKHVGFRIGVSKFFGRGRETCAGSSSPAPVAAAPVRPTPVGPVSPVAPPPAARPTATLSASPASIMSGQASTLSWNSTNATTCSAPWASGSGSSGSTTVRPTSTTTYTTTCTGAGGTADATTTVNVTQPEPPPTPTPAVTPTQPPREMFRLEGVYFDFDKSTIKPEGKVKLDSAVRILNRYTDMRVEIQGHTDSMGSDEYNMRLSDRRATSVREYLVSQGIAASRMTTRGFGESQPATSNDTAAGRAQNRRVMLIEMR